MGLDILANNSGAPDSQPPYPVSSSSCKNLSSGNTLTQNKQTQSSSLQEPCSDFHALTHVSAATNKHFDSGSASNAVPIVQLQGEGELNEMLDNFLNSFEQHGAREEIHGESSSKASQPSNSLSKCRKTQTITPDTPLQNTGRRQRVRRSETAVTQRSDEAEMQPSCLRQQKKTSARHAVYPKHAMGTSEKAPARKHKRRKNNQYMFSLERKRSVSSKLSPRILLFQEDKQLRQIPVVKLERTGLLPDNITVQRYNQSQEVKVTLLYSDSSYKNIKV